MRFVEYCDLGDAPEFLVQAVGGIALASPNIVRVTFVAKRPDSAFFGSSAHLLWDIVNYAAAVPSWRAGRAAIEQEIAAWQGQPARDLMRAVAGRAN